MRFHPHSKTKLAASLALCASALLGGAAWAQATHSVQANDHYFQGAMLGRWTGAAPGCNTGTAYSNVPASIGGIQYTATGNGGSGAGHCTNFSTPVTPANNNAQPVDAVSLHTNTVTFATASASTPFPEGTVLALQDVDANETVNVSFESCDGSALDTNDFTYVTISTGTAGLPNWSVSASGVWTISTSVAGAANPSVGIQMPANVCRIVLDSSATPVSGTNWFQAYLFQPASSFAPALDVAKSVASTGPYALGDTIRYQIVATNTGNVALSDVAISDANATMGACTPAAPALLLPGQALACEATHVVTAADMAARVVDNTADAEFTPPTVDPANPASPETRSSPQVSTPVGGLAAVPVNAPWALLLLGLGALGLGANALRRKSQG